MNPKYTWHSVEVGNVGDLDTVMIIVRWTSLVNDPEFTTGSVPCTVTTPERENGHLTHWGGIWIRSVEGP